MLNDHLKRGSSTLDHLNSIVDVPFHKLAAQCKGNVLRWCSNKKSQFHTSMMMPESTDMPTQEQDHRIEAAARKLINMTAATEAEANLSVRRMRLPIDKCGGIGLAASNSKRSVDYVCGAARTSHKIHTLSPHLADVNINSNLSRRWWLVTRR